MGLAWERKDASGGVVAERGLSEVGSTGLWGLGLTLGDFDGEVVHPEAVGS